MQNILTIIGARPQFIKAAVFSRVVLKVAGLREIIVHTGQHYDENMSDIFFRDLDIPKPDFHLGIGSASHATQTGEIMIGVERIIKETEPDMVLVYGDTNSTLAGTLSAAKMNVPIAHAEAGVRSFNRRMPEEINRIVTDAISDILFAPTDTAIKNLQKEGLSSNSCFSGDIMYDSVLYYAEKIRSLDNHLPDTIPDGKFYLTTIHRAENTDNAAILRSILKGISSLNLPVVLPVHPRTRNCLKKFDIVVPQNMVLIDPVGYLEMMQLVLASEKVLTDSGGLQKEAYFLSKPCVTLRNETEWVETLHDGWNVIAGTDPDQIVKAVNKPHPVAAKCDFFGDGTAANKMLAKIKDYLAFNSI